MKNSLNRVARLPLLGQFFAVFAVTTALNCTPVYFFGPEEPTTEKGGELVLPKGPYQMYVSPGELLIGAQLPPDSAAVLTYWKQGHEKTKSSVRFRPAWDGIQYVGLSELEPGTPYRMQVSLGDAVTREMPFQAGVVPGAPFSFLVIGDTKPDCELVHPTLVQEMSDRPASFYIHLGDYVGDGERVEDWELFFDLHKPLMNRIPIIPVVGNHDISEAGLFTGLFLFAQRGSDSNRYYASQYGNAELIILDSSAPISPGDKQYTFLRDALEGARANDEIEHIFVAIYNPPRSSGTQGGSGNLAEVVIPLIEQYPVTAVLSGRDHHYERSEPINDIVYVVSGGGGANLTKIDRQNFCAKALSAFHFVEIEIDGPKVTLRAFNVSGDLIDEARIK